MAPRKFLDNMTGQNGIVPVVVVDTAEKKTQSPSLLDADEFRRQSHQVVDLITEYYDRMGDYPVHPSVTPGFLRNLLPPDAPFRPEPDAFSRASTGPTGALGEALAAGINVVPHTSPSARPHALPASCVTTAAPYPRATTTCSLSRPRNCKRPCRLTWKPGWCHFSCARRWGRPRRLPSTPSASCALSVHHTACGCTWTLCTVAASHGVWVHVDAAYAGSALVCPEFRHVIDGVEAVDSFSMNAHKWLLANNDCCAMWVKRPSELVAALGTEQEYILKDAASEGHDVVVAAPKARPRRFRALKMWLVLRCYGIQGLRNHIRNHVRMAEAFEKMVKADERFEVVTDRKFALVCFRLRSPDKFGGADKQAANQLNRRLLEEVNAATSGPYMSSANVGGMFILRCAIGSTLTEDHHVSDAWKVVQDQATIILRH
ncbi:Tyrosine/DOPA decarboxylase 5 [Triticum urartu]|uniref:Tyrosine/DOPA decarboxylase 5 n=1 Tax=Triticum urartu TaxID=4572 RepID=M7ZZ77_TRIUA|nr:Tyrosine/DOPA decarboxylase 5 [Triticum urartu]